GGEGLPHQAPGHPSVPAGARRGAQGAGAGSSRAVSRRGRFTSGTGRSARSGQAGSGAGAGRFLLSGGGAGDTHGDGGHGRLRPVLDTQPAEGARQMSLDGLLREEQKPGYLAVGGASDEKAEDVHFSPGEPRGP